MHYQLLVLHYYNDSGQWEFEQTTHARIWPRTDTLLEIDASGPYYRCWCLPDHVEEGKRKLFDAVHAQQHLDASRIHERLHKLNQLRPRYVKEENREVHAADAHPVHR